MIFSLCCIALPTYCHCHLLPYIFNILAYIHHYLDQALPNLSLHVAGLYQFVSMVMHIKYIKEYFFKFKYMKYG